jgi:DNA-binding transcriptional LysR family regulator
MTVTNDQDLRLDVESLRVLREVVNANGFTTAGRHLGMTQSAVSHKIRRLEQRVGVELLRRDGAELMVTAEGADLLAHAEGIVAAHDAAVEALRRSPITGQVRLGCNEEVAATQLAAVASRFGRTHPGVRLEIVVDESVLVSQWLDEGEVDIALIQVIDAADQMRPDDEVWRRDKLTVVQAANADFDSADPLPLISFGPNCLYEPWLRAELDRQGRGYHRAMVCPSIQGVQAAVTAGLGVAVINGPHINTAMRPWSSGSLELPEVFFVLRSSAGPPTEQLVALKGHLVAAFEQERM